MKSLEAENGSGSTNISNWIWRTKFLRPGTPGDSGTAGVRVQPSGHESDRAVRLPGTYPVTQSATVLLHVSFTPGSPTKVQPDGHVDGIPSVPGS